MLYPETKSSDYTIATDDPRASASIVGERRRLDQVDVLRGLAAIWVVLSHYLPHWNDRLGPAPIIVPHSFGEYGVHLFFIISGFVIFATLERCRNVWDFAVLRFSRLYPAYWTSLLVVTVVSVVVFGDTLWWGGVMANMTMFHEFIGFPHLDIVYWSLTVELAFYLNVAWLLAFGLHRRVYAIVVVWLVSACVWTMVAEQPAGLDERHWFALLFAADYAPYFVVGIVFYDALRHGWRRSSTGLLVLAFATQFFLEGLEGTVVIALATSIFAAAVYGHLRFMVNRLTLYLGTISFSLYLVHRNLGYSALDWMHAQGVHVGIAVPITMLGAIILAALLTSGIEQPALKRIRARYETRK
jgi:peptidoglycan/LPS O-acetylase OafA/YrhL